jgi:hypothetical protein
VIGGGISKIVGIKRMEKLGLMVLIIEKGGME